jgi:hypothetical protein
MHTYGSKADVVKLAYTTALGAVGRKTVGVQLSPSAVETVISGQLPVTR